MSSTVTTCCFKFSRPPVSGSSDSSSIAPRVFSMSRRNWTIDEPQPPPPSWRSQCATVAAGLAYVVIGIGSAGSILCDESFALVEDMELEATVAKQRERVARWSDKRACPPWRSKSFELVVPENLPRVPARRKVESVGHYSANAPAIGTRTGAKVKDSCFSL